MVVIRASRSSATQHLLDQSIQRLWRETLLQVKDAYKVRFRYESRILSRKWIPARGAEKGQPAFAYLVRGAARQNGSLEFGEESVDPDLEQPGLIRHKGALAKAQVEDNRGKCAV